MSSLESNNQELDECLNNFEFEIPSLESYNQEHDDCLKKFEIAAKMEKYYLLYSTYFVNINFQVGCGLSPARSFSSAITLSSLHNLSIISFSNHEWKRFIELSEQKVDDFFHDPSVTSDYVSYMCSDFTKVTQMSFENGDVKVLEVSKHGVNLYLCEEDILAIIDADSKLIKLQMTLVESLNFSLFYYNLINTINSITTTNIPNLKLELMQLLYGSCNNENVLLLRALSEYMYFYKDKVLNDIQ